MTASIVNAAAGVETVDPGGGDLFAQVYDDLRQLAERALSGERAGHTLQPTALVHEVYLRLLGPAGAPPRWQSRRHFYAAAAEAMRRILVDAARRKGRAKRGGGRERLPVDLEQVAGPTVPDEVLALDDALTRLAAAEPLVAELVHLRYFVGLTQKDAAETLDLPLRTANSYWAYARAWLQADMTAGDPPG